MFHALQYLSLRYWLRHRGAFLLASLGVTLGIAVFVAIQVANASVLNAFSASIDAVAGRANLQVRGGANGLPENVFARIVERGDPRILAAAPQLTRTLYSPTLQTSLLVSGLDIFSEIPFRSRDLPSPAEHETGNPRDAVGGFRFLLDPNAIAISQSLAQRNKLQVGSKLQLSVGPRRESFDVVAILSDEASGRAFGGDYALLDIATAQEKLGALGQISGVDLIVEENQVDAVRTELQKLVPPDATVARPAQRSQQVAGMLAAFQLNLTALSSIAAFVGAFLIYNAMASAVVRRRSEVGILRAVGASKRQIMLLFTGEAALIGAFGGVAGFLLGLLIARWTLGAVATTVSQLYLAVKASELFVPVWLLPVSVLSGLVLSVLAALPSASEAASTSPRATLTGSSLHLAVEKLTPRLLLCGIGLGIVAGILCLPAVSGRSPMLGFFASGATLGAFALAVPFLLLRIARFIRPLAERLGGIEGALAADNLRRALNRSTLVIAALFVSLSLTIGMNLMVRSFRATVAGWIDRTISADLYIATSSGFSGERSPGLPQEVIQWAKANPQVRGVDNVRQAPVEIRGQLATLYANELPALTSGDRIIRFVETQGGEANAEREFGAGRAVLLSERLSNLLNLHAGDQLTFPTPKGQRSFPIAGVFYDYNPTSVFYLQRGVYQKLWNDDQIDGLALYLQPGVSGDDLKRQIDRKFGAKYALQLLPNAEIRHEVFDTFDQTFAVTYALQLIALVVAAIGVFDTLVSMMLERTSEMASLRAMGASRRQIQTTAFWEFGLLGLVAWVLGSVSGAILAAQIIFIINRQFFGWTIFPQFSLVVFGQAFGLALIASLGAGFIPAVQSAKRNLAATLQRE